MLNIPVWQLWFMKHSGYDVLILPAPIWVSYEPQERIIGRQIKWLQTEKENNFKITTRARILVLNSPHNPTSVTYSKEELEDISIIARKHRLIVLSDEIYSALNHSEDITYSPSIAKYYPEGTIVLTGISKWCGAGGWRLGALVFPKQMRWLLDASAIIASETYTSVSSPIQYGAIPAFRDFESNEMQEYLHNCNKVLSAIGKRFQYKLTEEAGAFCAKPNGGFYLFPDFGSVPGIENMAKKWAIENNRRAETFSSKELTMYLLRECGVAGLGGAYFGRPNPELSMRLSYVDFDGTKLLENSKDIPDNEMSDKMDDFLNKYAAKTMKGIDVLSQYLKSLSK